MDILRRALNSEFRWSKDSPNQWEIVTLLEKDKKSMYRGARFWYLVRKYLPYYYPIVFLVFMILSLTVYKTVEGSLVLGSILSLLMSSSVLASYIMIIPWRKHPSTLVLYRALTSMIFSFTILFEAISTSQDACQTYAVFTQFSVLSGECWLTTIALDLVYSLTNPFISYKSNLKKYHTLVWVFTGLLTFIFYCDTPCQGQFDQGLCWVNITSTNSPCLWGYFLFWIVCMYVYQIYASVYAYFRLKKGLPTTFDVRVKCAKETFTILSAYAVYLSLLVLMFIIISSEPAPKPDSNMAKFAIFYLFLVSNKGSLDGIIWFYLHDFPHEKQLQEQYDRKYGIDRKSTHEFSHNLENIEAADDDDEMDTLPTSQLLNRHKRKEKNIKQIEEKLKESMTKTLTELADLAIAEFDESDLSPQVNTALRTQIVQYVTTGVRNAVLRTGIDIKPNTEISDIMDNAFKRPDPAVTPGLQVLEFLLDKEYPFKAFAPDLFEELRRLEGIDSQMFIKVLSDSANERLSEGASGAFMFFCGGGEYIVKTIRAREAAVLHSFLPVYASYIKRHPDSLLCRFLGSYSLEVYSQTFYFVVMLNCFDPSAYINERFDIKGSWVGRSAEPGKKTKRQVCRHCNEYFVPAKMTQCKAIVGGHEANVVLKDNDLRTKISLPPLEAARVLKVLKRDSELLGKLGVLDYSLLIGVKKWKFGVEVTQNMTDFNPSSSNDGKHNFIHKGPASTFHAHSVTGPAIYHFGIIDFLQNWTFQKRIERAFKIYITRKDPDGLSVMPPLQYKTRFQAKLEQIFDVEGATGGIGAVTVVRQSPPLKPPKKWSGSNSENDSNIKDENSVIEMATIHSEPQKETASSDVTSASFVMPKLDLQHSLDLGRQKQNDFDDFDDDV